MFGPAVMSNENQTHHQTAFPCEFGDENPWKFGALKVQQLIQVVWSLKGLMNQQVFLKH